MQELSITQEFLMCALNRKGEFSNNEKLQSICLVISGLLELQEAGYIQLERGKVTITRKFDNEKSYLKPLYNSINERKKESTIEDLVTDYVISISGKKFAEYFSSVGNSLVDQNCTVLESGFFKANKYYIPDEESKERIIKKIRTAVEEDEAINQEMAILILFLDRSESLKQNFSKKEREQLKSRQKEIKTSDHYKNVRAIIKLIDDIFARVVACAVVK